MNDKELIQRVRILKALRYIKSYKELAVKLDISEKAFYNWMGGYYSLSYSKKQKLDKILKKCNV